MARYVTRPKASGWIEDSLYDEDGLKPELSVDDHEPVDTGLITETGDPIMRLPNPMGFGRDEEW